MQRNFYHVQWGLLILMNHVPPTRLKVISDSQRRRMRKAPDGTLSMKTPDFTGVKKLVVRFGQREFLTPYGVKTMKRRRAARKVAHESRRRNR